MPVGPASTVAGSARCACTLLPALKLRLLGAADAADEQAAKRRRLESSSLLMPPFGGGGGGAPGSLPSLNLGLSMMGAQGLGQGLGQGLTPTGLGNFGFARDSHTQLQQQQPQQHFGGGGGGGPGGQPGFELLQPPQPQPTPPPVTAPPLLHAQPQQQQVGLGITFTPANMPIVHSCIVVIRLSCAAPQQLPQSMVHM
jgi:hypothetical protein